MRPATSNLARSWGLARRIVKSHQKKSGCGPGLGELPKIWWTPFDISATAGASDFKFCRQLGFAKAHHKITPGGKVGMAMGYGCSPKFGVSLQYFCNG